MTKEIKLSFIGEHLHHSYVYLHGTSIKVVNNLAGQQLLAFPTRMQVIFLEILINPSMIHCNYDNNIISGSSFIVDPPNHDIFVFITYPLVVISLGIRLTNMIFGSTYIPLPSHLLTSYLPTHREIGRLYYCPRKYDRWCHLKQSGTMKKRFCIFPHFPLCFPDL